MSMNTILRNKRKELGLTQEQVANYLGVTTPAVNKWEKGTTCPDLMLLSALARLLRTDPNTLLCFEESLTENEIGLFLNEIVSKISEEGFAKGFMLAMEKIRQYPNCARLLYSVAMLLDGSLMMADLPETEKGTYRTQIVSLYERVTQCGDPELVNHSCYMLASKLLEQSKYPEVKKILDKLPEHSTLDKRMLQAELWAKEGKLNEAVTLLERMALNSLQDNQITLVKLVPLLIAEGDEETAIRLAKASQVMCQAFGFWQYSAYLVPMQTAVARKDVRESLTVISAMLEAVLKPWDVHKSPLFRHVPQKEGAENMGKAFLPPILEDLERNPEYDFLRSEPEFSQLLATYRSKCMD